MIHAGARKVVVIRGVDSKYVEEAILILKNDAVVPVAPTTNSAINSYTKHNSDLLVKEAQTIIDNYVNQERNGQGESVKRGKNPLQPLQGRIRMNTIINTALVISIALLILVLFRIF